MRSSSLNIIDLLKQTINDISQNIHDYIDDDQAFTRQRKYLAKRQLKLSSTKYILQLIKNWLMSLRRISMYRQQLLFNKR